MGSKEEMGKKQGHSSDWASAEAKQLPMAGFGIPHLYQVFHETMYSPEIQVFDRELGLNDACGFDSRA